MNLLATLKDVLRQARDLFLKIVADIRAWFAQRAAGGLPKPRLAPVVDAVEAVAGAAVEGVSAAAGVVTRAETRKPGLALDVGLAIGGALLFLGLVLGCSWHAYRHGVAAEAGVATAWKSRAEAAETVSAGNAAAVSRLERSKSELVAEMERRDHEGTAAEARYAGALDAARKATDVAREETRRTAVACHAGVHQALTGKVDPTPAGDAPMAKSMRDALRALRKGEPK